MRHEHEHEKELAVEVGSHDEAKGITGDVEDQYHTTTGHLDLIGAAPCFAHIPETAPRSRQCRLEPSFEGSFGAGMKFGVFTDAGGFDDPHCTQSVCIGGVCQGATAESSRRPQAMDADKRR